MHVEKDAGVFLGWGIVAGLLGGGIYLNGWIDNLTASPFSQSSNDGLIVGAILTLVGTGLVIAGIYQVAHNIEVSGVANVSAEGHLRWMRESMLAQQEETLASRPAGGEATGGAEGVPDDHVP